MSRSRFLSAAEVVASLKFRRQVEHLHSLGARAVGELLAEIGAERSIQTLIDRKIDTYAALKPEALKSTGGDDFWPAPLREVWSCFAAAGSGSRTYSPADSTRRIAQPETKG